MSHEKRRFQPAQEVLDQLGLSPLMIEGTSVRRLIQQLAENVQIRGDGETRDLVQAALQSEEPEQALRDLLASLKE